MRSRHAHTRATVPGSSTARTTAPRPAAKAMAVAVVLTLTLSACSLFESDDSVQEPGAADSERPETVYGGTVSSPEVFEQDFGTGDQIADPVSIEITDARAGGHMGQENVGISLESTDLADPRLDPESSTIADRLNELGSPALRFGGNRLDRNVFWTSSDEDPPDEEHIAVTPDDLDRLNRLVEATGSSVTLGIPLGTYDPARGADMAAHAHEILGDSLLAVAVGNEPNGYTVDGDPNHRLREDDWGVDEYQDQLRDYVSAIHSRAPDLSIVGPDAYDAEWMRGFADSGVEDQAAIAQHWYALYECESTDRPGRGPYASNLVTPLVHDTAAEMLGIGMDVAADAGVPLWIEEAGPTSCPGTNDTSRTQAQALWTVDFALNAALVGAERLALHSALAPCEGGPPMSVVCSAQEGGDQVLGQVGHSALRLASQSAGGEFVDVSTEGGGDALRAYAVQDDEDRIVLTVLNKADAAQVSRTPVRASLPDGYAATEAAQITADSLETTGGTVFTAPAPLPDDLPYSGPEGEPEETAGAAEADDETTGNEDGEDDELFLDFDASAATTIVFERTDS